MGHERLVQVLALDFKCFGHARDRHMQAPPEYREGLGQAAFEAHSRGITVQLDRHGVVPAQATFRDLVQRSIVASRQLSKCERRLSLHDEPCPRYRSKARARKLRLRFWLYPE
jgi:hypothetical protein